MSSTETLEQVLAILDTDREGFWLLIGEMGTPQEERRRAALMSLLVAAYGSGYDKGLRRRADFVKGVRDAAR
jgi:hypothetical protein